MVGVPRSRGCKLCLERRVKVLNSRDLPCLSTNILQCDEKRPGCLQCLRQGHPCPGYKYRIEFRDEGPRLRQRVEQSIAVPRRTETTTADLSDAEEQRMGWVVDLHEFENGREELVVCLSPARPLLSPSIHQQQLLHTFIWSMTALHQNELSPALGTYRRWLPHLFPVTGTHTLLDQSVRACTLAHVGRLHRSNTFMHEAQVHYGSALRHLNDALRDPSRGLASEALGSTILLSIFEMFMSNSNQSWVRHADGVVTLMKLRGPHRHRIGIDREMFLAYRRTLVSQAMQSNQKTFLNEPEWRQLSRDVHDDIRRSGVFADIVNSEIFEVDQLFFLESATLCDLCHDLRHVGRLAQMSGKDAVDITSRLVISASSCRRTIKSLLRRLKTAIKGAGHETITCRIYQHVRGVVARWSLDNRRPRKHAADEVRTLAAEGSTIPHGERSNGKRVLPKCRLHGNIVVSGTVFHASCVTDMSSRAR